MGLNYKVQQDIAAIGTVASPETLTADFADNTFIIPLERMAQLELYVTYTPAGNGRVVSIKLEFGQNRTDFYQAVSSTDSTGTETLHQRVSEFTGATASTAYKFRVSEPVADRFVKVSVKEDGVATFGTITVLATVSGT